MCNNVVTVVQNSLQSLLKQQLRCFSFPRSKSLRGEGKGRAPGTNTTYKLNRAAALWGWEDSEVKVEDSTGFFVSTESEASLFLHYYLNSIFANLLAHLFLFSFFSWPFSQFQHIAYKKGEIFKGGRKEGRRKKKKKGKTTETWYGVLWSWGPIHKLERTPIWYNLSSFLLRIWPHAFSELPSMFKDQWLLCFFPTGSHFSHFAGTPYLHWLGTVLFLSYCLLFLSFIFLVFCCKLVLVGQAQYSCNLDPYTPYLAVNYMDRFISRQDIPV